MVLRWPRHRLLSPCSLLWQIAACALVTILIANWEVEAIFEEPKPLAIWEDPMPTNIRRPTSWAEKSFGQWCRNFTMNSHVQCPEGSGFHWYYCCGHLNTECCVSIQTWAIVVFGSFILLGIIIAVVSILAYFDLLWSNKIEKRVPKPNKQISKKYVTVSGATI